MKKVLETQPGGEHYKKLAIQVVEYIHANKLPFFEGNVVKYVTRHRDKGGEQDIRKAIHYLEMILEFDYGCAPTTDGRGAHGAVQESLEDSEAGGSDGFFGTWLESRRNGS